MPRYPRVFRQTRVAAVMVVDAPAQTAFLLKYSGRGDRSRVFYMHVICLVLPPTLVETVPVKK